MLNGFKTWLAKLEANPKLAPYLQFIKFGLVGASNTLLSLAIYWLCLSAFGWHYQLANVVSFFISVVNAYFWNSRYVFRAAKRYTLRQHLLAFGRTLASYGGTFLLNTALLTLLVELCHVSEALSQVLATCATIPLNFLLNKYWTFREKRKGTDPKNADSAPDTTEQSHP